MKVNLCPRTEGPKVCSFEVVRLDVHVVESASQVDGVQRNSPGPGREKELIIAYSLILAAQAITPPMTMSELLDILDTPSGHAALHYVAEDCELERT